MLFKFIIVALTACITGTSAQTSPSIQFTNPVGESQVYQAGSQQTFSWINACQGQTDPTQFSVNLLDATNPTAAVFLQPVSTIDCTKSSGHQTWTVPSTASGFVSSGKIFILTFTSSTFPDAVYSGVFTIEANGQASNKTSTSTTRTPTIVPTAPVTETKTNTTSSSTTSATAATQTTKNGSSSIISIPWMATAAVIVGLSVALI